MADNVSFKVYLRDHTNGEGGDEVRRFMVDKDVSTSLIYIKEKLLVVFPQLGDKTFTISWTDEDGDCITIDSDEELILALAEMPGPVYKLVVFIKGTKKADKPMEENTASSTAHPGVTCDGCEKGIIGYRYKCVVCEDYDLCSKCESAGKHPGHNMMRIANPEVIWPQRLFKRLHKMQEKAEARSRSRQERMEEGSTQPPPFCFPRGRGMFRGCAGRGGRGGRGGMPGAPGMPGMPPPMPGMPGMPPPHHWASAWAGPAMEAMMRGWMGEPEQGDASQGHQEAHQDAKASADAAHEFAHSAAHQTAHAAAASAAAHATQAAEDAFAAAGIPKSKSAEYLQKVGDFVAAALDPLGIDVQVDVETPTGDKTTVRASSSSSSTSSTVEKMEEDTEKEKMDVQEVEKKKDSSMANSDDEDWTVLNDKKEESKTTEIPIQVEGVAATASINYPTLPEAEGSSPDTVQDTVMEEEKPTAPLAIHPDPKIQVALQAMMNMGFSNDGGWLANLLEAKNGDIGKVLDILQPVKK